MRARRASGAAAANGPRAEAVRLACLQGGLRIVTETMPQLATAALGCGSARGPDMSGKASRVLPICSNIWPSRERKGGPRWRSPRKSKASAAT
jgi:hypothetical protein